MGMQHCIMTKPVDFADNYRWISEHCYPFAKGSLKLNVLRRLQKSPLGAF
jgi:hypothetical protein